MSRRRRRLAPEVVQTSAMDCGPACLSSLLEGHGIRAAYGRLREACQTDLDGTSIDTLEEAAVTLGLDAEQIMLPADHLLLPESAALPAIVVVRQPSGLTHFVIVWRRHGRWLQVMDPATGRRWPTSRRFLAELFIHQLPVPAAAWREWAGGEESRAALAARLGRLGLGRRRRAGLIDAADAEPGWARLAGLDAAARMVQSIIDGGGLTAGRSAGALLASLAERAAAEAGGELHSVPDAYWSVRPPATPGPPGEEPEEERLLLRGAVLVRCRGHRPAAAAESLSPELAAAINEPPSRPGRTLWRLIRASGRAPLAALGALLALAAGGVVFEALLFRGFFDVGRELGLTAQRFAGIGALLLFLASLLLLEWPLARGILRLGRQLESRLRIAFLEKVPKLGDRYFRSRLTSDLAGRCHSVHRLRLLPELGEGVGRTVLELLLTTTAIVWLDPGSLPLALAAAAIALVLPLLVLPWLTERDLREREHSGALSRFYLDALLGLVPLRTHGAQRAVEREHESLLVEWVSARLGRERMIVGLDLVMHPVLLGLVGWLLVDHLGRRDLTSGVLLLVFWSLNLFNLGRLAALLLAHQYPSHRSIALRLLEPLGAPDEVERPAAERPPEGAGPVAVELQNVAVRVAGHGILESIDLAITPGEHLAIVGPSGAGKSSLVGLFLGWYRPAEGRLLLDGEPLVADRLAALRRATAWVDPQVQLWNRSLLDNLLYGGEATAEVGQVVRQAELLELLQELPDGLQTPLGESGALVSGGEGQRVRLARAMLRPGVRLAILDEPFRGLARDQRRGLLARARRLWKDATLLAVTHDIEETLYFDRVLVIDNRRLIEDGRPTELAERTDSAYRRLLLAERDVRSAVWADPAWRRLRVEGGRIVESPGGRR